MSDIQDRVDPATVPKCKLFTAAEIPRIGLGTFGSDRFSGEQIAKAVKGAIAVGYRHIDCAAVYGNENRIGPALAEAMSEGVRREELWNDKHAAEDVAPTCKQSLADLGLDYLDLYLIHWPFPNYHAPGCGMDSRSPDAKPYIHENFMRTWRQLEKLVDIEDPVIVAIAERLGVHPAVVCVKWAVQRGQIPIPFSIHDNKYLSNLQSTVSDPLTEDDMAAITGIDKNCRLIKGQVFLWKENQSWEALWDMDGTITPA